MKKIILMPLTITLALCASCTGGGKKQQENAAETAKEPVVLTDPAKWEEVYTRITPAEIPGNPIELIGKGWMLITSGTQEGYNTMTASWGALGEVWSLPTAFITVRNTRYTNQFLEKNDTFTLSFFDEGYRPALQLLGTKSGRDGDKVAEAGLTPVATPGGSMSFGEARMVLECRKLYADPMEREKLAPEVAAKIYGNTPAEEYHILYAGEITAAWIKR